MHIIKDIKLIDGENIEFKAELKNQYTIDARFKLDYDSRIFLDLRNEDLILNWFNLEGVNIFENMLKEIVIDFIIENIKNGKIFLFNIFPNNMVNLDFVNK